MLSTLDLILAQFVSLPPLDLYTTAQPPMWAELFLISCGRSGPSRCDQFTWQVVPALQCGLPIALPLSLLSTLLYRVGPLKRSKRGNAQLQVTTCAPKGGSSRGVGAEGGKNNELTRSLATSCNSHTTESLLFFGPPPSWSLCIGETAGGWCLVRVWPLRRFVAFRAPSLSAHHNNHHHRSPRGLLLPSRYVPTVTSAAPLWSRCSFMAAANGGEPNLACSLLSSNDGLSPASVVRLRSFLTLYSRTWISSSARAASR